MSQPQTQKWLGRIHVALTSLTLVILHAWSFQWNQLSRSLIAGTSVAHVNTLVRLCDTSGPATRQCTGHWLGEPLFVTVAVTRPCSVLSARFCKTLWPGSRLPLSGPSESSHNGEFPTSPSNQLTNSMVQRLSGEVDRCLCSTSLIHRYPPVILILRLMNPVPSVFLQDPH